MSNITQKKPPSAAEMISGIEREQNPAAYGRIAAIFDEGSFVQTQRFYKTSVGEYDAAEGYASVITGYGAVNGELVYVYAEEPGRERGAVGAAHAKKIIGAIDAAMSVGAPIIGILDSAGGRIAEGVSCLTGYARLIAKIDEARGVIPQITIAAGAVTGLLSVAAKSTDVIISTAEGRLYAAPPSLSGKKDGASANITVKDFSQAAETVKSLIALISGGSEVSDDPERAVNSAKPEEILDGKSYHMINYDPKNAVKTYIGSVGGVSVALIYCDGALDTDGAGEAGRAVTLASSLDLPIVTVIKNASVSPSVCPTALARLASAYANHDGASVTVIAGAAHGAAYALLGSKAIGADTVYATPDAVISPLPTAAAAEFLYGDEINKAKDPTAARNEFESALAALASPTVAACEGEVDDLIEVEQIRARIASALYMLEA